MLHRNIPAPQAVKKPTLLTKFDSQRRDDYFYFKDKGDQSVIDYINEENQYTEAVMADTQELQQAIFEEIKGRIKEDDESYPVLSNGYYYFSEIKQGEQYRRYFRSKTFGGTKELLFDVNAMAEGCDAFIFAGYVVSPDNKKCAYAFNSTGSYADYQIKIRDLLTGEDYDLSLERTSAAMAWSSDSQSLLYTVVNDALRPYEIRALSLDDMSTSQSLFREDDERFVCAIRQTKEMKYLLIATHSSTSSEIHLVDAAQVLAPPRLVLPRAEHVEYSLYPHGDHFFIRYKTKETLNGEIFRARSEHVADMSSWESWVAHSQRLIEAIDVFADHLALAFRNNGLIELELLKLSDKSVQKISFPEEVYDAHFAANPEFTQDKIHYSYSSLNRPTTLFAFDLNEKSSEILKQQEIPSGLNPDDYGVERLWAQASDGVKVPYALVYKKGLIKYGSSPTLLYSYGSYGISTDFRFRSAMMALVDRGFVVAFAQIRGGSELGEAWYEDGKFLNKKNTFTDFISVAEDLITQGYTNSQKLAIMGGSAGGLLMGAVTNMRPDLFKCVVALVPFIDVVTTMLDDSLPLTTGEYEEWGNPNDKIYFDYMLSYSPYDNIKAVDFPDIFVSGGINDSQVLFHEPTKYVAKLRDFNTASSTIVLSMDMKSGHGGATGRYDSIKDTAKYMAFIIASLSS